jgi:hypothetical protein
MTTIHPWNSPTWNSATLVSGTRIESTVCVANELESSAVTSDTTSGRVRVARYARRSSRSAGMAARYSSKILWHRGEMAVERRAQPQHFRRATGAVRRQKLGERVGSAVGPEALDLGESRLGAAVLDGHADHFVAHPAHELLREGHGPIVYCRFIATAEYVGEQLQSMLQRVHKGLHVASVTGGDGDSEQRAEEGR